MVESYVGVEIPYTYSDWKEVYSYIVAIEGENKLLFCRDVFHAKVGLFLGTNLFSLADQDGDTILEFAVNNALEETITYLLTLTSLTDEWKNFKYLYNAMKCRRNRACLLLIGDGRCFTDVRNIPFAINYAVTCNLTQVFFRLIELYPTNIPSTLIDHYDIASVHGMIEVAQKIVDLFDIVPDNTILRFVKNGVINDDILAIANNEFRKYLIVDGRTLESYSLLSWPWRRPQVNKGEISDAIEEAISLGNVLTLSQVASYIEDEYITQWRILRKCTAINNTDVLPQVTHLARQIYNITSKHNQGLAIISAKVHGNYNMLL
jgi:hypothetical protein